MRNLLLVAVVALFAFSVWQLMNGLTDAGKLRTAMGDVIEDARDKSEAELQQMMVAKSEKVGVPVKAEQVTATWSRPDGSILGGQINNQGLRTNAREVHLKVNYTYHVLLFGISPTIEDGRRFTTATMIENPAYQNLGQ